MTLANRLTLLRIGLVAPYALAVLAGQLWLAATLFAAAAATDLLDGYIARKRNEETALGAALDPIADKMLTVTALIVLVANDTLTGWAIAGAVVIVMREIWVAGLRESLVSNDAELPVTLFAKAKTSVQLAGLLVLTLGPSLLGMALLWGAVGLTLYTGYQYTRLSLKVLNLGTDEGTG
ncbi:MAG: CDP-alcohol phosphatidyltransferase family protein [Pseudomonadota bacterium]